MKCHKCHQSGHKAADCNKELLCADCNQPGHTKGDSKCSKKIVADIPPEFQLDSSKEQANLDESREEGELTSDIEEISDSEDENLDETVTKHINKNLALLKSLSSKEMKDDQNLVFPELIQVISHTQVSDLNDEHNKVSENIATEMEKDIDDANQEKKPNDTHQPFTQQEISYSEVLIHGIRSNEINSDNARDEVQKTNNNMENIESHNLQGQKNLASDLNTSDKKTENQNTTKSKEPKKKVKHPKTAQKQVSNKSANSDKMTDKGKSSNQVGSKNTQNIEYEVRKTARRASRGSIDFYVNQASKVREESRGSKRSSTSPLRGIERKSKIAKDVLGHK